MSSERRRRQRVVGGVRAAVRAWRTRRERSDGLDGAASPAGGRASPRAIRADVMWVLAPADVTARRRPGSSYRPLVWLGSGQPDFVTGEVTPGGVLVGAVCSWIGDYDSRDRIGLQFWAQFDIGDFVTPGTPVTLLEGHRTVARGVVVDGTT